MNSEDIWKGFLEQAPKAADPEEVIKLRARGIKKLIEQAFEEGKKRGAAEEIWKQQLSEFSKGRDKEDMMGKLNEFLKGMKGKI